MKRNGKGLLRADIDVALLQDEKVRRLARQMGDERDLSAALVVFLATLLGSWGEGERMTAEEADCSWVAATPERIAALQRVGLLDAEGRVSAGAFDSWYGPAIARVVAKRELGARGGRATAAKRGGPPPPAAHGAPPAAAHAAPPAPPQDKTSQEGQGSQGLEGTVVAREPSTSEQLGLGPVGHVDAARPAEPEPGGATAEAHAALADPAATEAERAAAAEWLSLGPKLAAMANEPIRKTRTYGDRAPVRSSAPPAPALTNGHAPDQSEGMAAALEAVLGRPHRRGEITRANRDAKTYGLAAYLESLVASRAARDPVGAARELLRPSGRGEA